MGVLKVLEIIVLRLRNVPLTVADPGIVRPGKRRHEFQNSDSQQWRIQELPDEGVVNRQVKTKNFYLARFHADNCMAMKEIRKGLVSLDFKKPQYDLKVQQ